MDAELDRLEEELNKLSPLGMPDDMISRLDNAMARWHEHVPVEEKVVPLNQGAAEENGGHWLGWKSVAAVAVMGAGMAFFFKGATPSTQSEIVNSPSQNPYPSISTTAFSPSDARASLVSANPAGVVWTESGQPWHRLEVNTNKIVSFENEDGDKYIIKAPDKKVLMAPAKID